ncbi:Glyoxalase/Bleomycin resistance protein/Dihydroxybiphenyl dioxygenase [Colletotrichum phormii]|uniref:Glyoxalase/Bleomycin resistance protein/Dihydroxybiphenyl dioxygenase n=1 Tax=Colletotrichum phormii TaxID=359342 RepID=A0AAJ0EHJ5_9PEZI|nr:Glyoxalase/Bleomycin resistance protein/Dihydroxybiphenyl dioxygenase [Colletotrichum phormii]KAK1639323.1 Glyoxalase/Bleomycin resistance protein/Dihydroxybiphenyl dioxygenase [Colletotrichum phormii]
MAEGEEIGSAWKIIPSLSSRNIAATVEFYTSELGFTLGGTKSENDDDSQLYFYSVYAGNKTAANIYFFLCDDNEFHPGGVMIALGTAGLDHFQDLLISRGNVEVVEAIRDTPWGYRQFTIKDNDGNRLTFFKFLEGGNPGTD